MGLDWIIDCEKEDCDNCRHKKKIEKIAGLVRGVVAPPCSYRGKLIGSVYYANEIPKNLRNKAYMDLSPTQMIEYANELEEVVNNIKDVEYRQNVLAGIEWLRYWASQGKSMIAWY